jgi:hypothetical protein
MNRQNAFRLAAAELRGRVGRPRYASLAVPVRGLVGMHALHPRPARRGAHRHFRTGLREHTVAFDVEYGKRPFVQQPCPRKP